MKRCALLLLLSGIVPFARATENPFNLPAKTDAALHRTFEALFNEQFDEADRLLATMASQKNDVPIVAMAFVIREWWKMSLNILETDSKASEPFLKAAELCGKVSKAKLTDKKKAGQAAFAWGTTLGLLSRYSVSNRAWIAAYVRGNKAVDQCRSALKKNPNFADPYMTIGTFNYAKTLLSSYMDSAEAKAANVDVNNGLKQLRKAAAESVYFRHASNLLLAGILTNDAPKEAVPLLRRLRTDLPQSAFVHMVLMTALYNVGDLPQMAVEADAFEQNLSSDAYPASYRPQAFFVRGLMALREKEWKDAAALFNEAIKASTVENPYQAWSHLYRGYALDAWGKRKDAIKEYNRVLELRRCFASHDHARARLQTPFKPTDPEMTKLEL